MIIEEMMRIQLRPGELIVAATQFQADIILITDMGCMYRATYDSARDIRVSPIPLEHRD